MNGNTKIRDIILSFLFGALLTSGGYQLTMSGKVAAATWQANENRQDISDLTGLVATVVAQNTQLLAELRASKP